MKNEVLHTKRTLFYTEDGSASLRLPELNEQYHSKHGALQESRYVYIERGLEPVRQNLDKPQIDILEMGFGTGLNAMLTAVWAEKNGGTVDYTTVEAYPLKEEEWGALQYGTLFPEIKAPAALFKELHQGAWGEWVSLTPHFKILKQKQRFEDFKPERQFDLVYFDAFGARIQPELWTAPIFEMLYASLRNKGVLVTYSAKGSVRRLMQELGFKVERLPGPPGKREMLRGIKE